MTTVNCYFIVFQLVARLSDVFKEQLDLFFTEKNGHADGRNTRLFGALRIVFGLHLSICGVVDLPILGSNLVKTGVQDAIFDRF